MQYYVCISPAVFSSHVVTPIILTLIIFSKQSFPVPMKLEAGAERVAMISGPWNVLSNRYDVLDIFISQPCHFPHLTSPALALCCTEGQ